MERDPAPAREPPSTDDAARTKEAKRVIEEYARELREFLRRLRSRFTS